MNTYKNSVYGNDRSTPLPDRFDGYLHEEDDVVFRDRDVEIIVGIALKNVPGILCVKSGLSDLFKRDDDWSRGVSAHVSSNDEVSVKARLIVNDAFDGSHVITDATRAITDAIVAETPLLPQRVELEIAGCMSLAEFEEKYGVSPVHC